MLDPYTPFTLVILAGWATFFYRAGEVQTESGIPWAIISVTGFLVTWLYLGWGWLGCCAAQVVLFVGIGIVLGLQRGGWPEFLRPEKKRKKRKKRKVGKKPNAAEAPPSP